VRILFIPANADILHIDTEPRYTSALQSLSHVLVLTPQNPFYVLQAGETAYTAQDIPLAVRFFLMVIEMTGDDKDDAGLPPPTGITIRAWYGVEMVSVLTSPAQSQSLMRPNIFPSSQSMARLDAEPTLGTSSPSKTGPPEHLPKLRKLAREAITSAQAGRQDDEVKASSSWLSR
jgi:hypothetical protein